MNRYWSKRAAFVGAGLGLLVGILMLSLSWVISSSLQRQVDDVSSDSLLARVISKLDRIVVPTTSYGDDGGIEQVLSDIAVLQLTLGDVREALSTIRSVKNPVERVRIFSRIHGGSDYSGAVPVGAASAPAPTGEATDADDADVVPTTNGVDSDLHAEWMLNALDALTISLDPQPEIDGFADDSNTEARSRSLATMLNDKAVALYELATLYVDYQEDEKAKDALKMARKAAIAFQDSGFAPEPADPEIYDNDTQPVLSQVAVSPDAKVSPWTDKLLSAVWLVFFTVVCGVVGGVSKPLLEGFGKAVLARVVAGMLGNEDFAKEFGINLAAAQQATPGAGTAPESTDQSVEHAAGTPPDPESTAV